MLSFSETTEERGFTFFEIMVAVAISVIVVGVVTFVFGRTEQFRRYTEKRMRYAAQWQAFQSMFERELAGTYDYRGNAFGAGADPFVVTPVANPPGHRLKFVTAVENSGPADFVNITYYLVRDVSDPSKNGLYRKVWCPADPEPLDEEKWRCFPDVQGFTVSPEVSGPPPDSVTVTVTFADPTEPEVSVWTFTQTFVVRTSVP